ncbi:MAG TPA: hypothetical protein VM910_27170 [Bradyrhizobium sp.]|jgi:hypothetical protein|nr:hypothetical protein [Bradyrhizobium sp.]
MAFKPNYRRDRAERQRAARARTEEKQRKKEEKAALRKAEREATEAPPDEKQTISIAMPFNASTRATITLCNGLRRIDCRHLG